MSTLRSVGNTLDLFAEPNSSRAVIRRFVGPVQTFWTAIRDGLAAARAYHELTRRGTPHETAVKRVFDQHFGR